MESYSASLRALVSQSTLCCDYKARLEHAVSLIQQLGQLAHVTVESHKLLDLSLPKVDWLIAPVPSSPQPNHAGKAIHGPQPVLAADPAARLQRPDHSSHATANGSAAPLGSALPSGLPGSALSDVAADSNRPTGIAGVGTAAAEVPMPTVPLHASVAVGQQHGEAGAPASHLPQPPTGAPPSVLAKSIHPRALATANPPPRPSGQWSGATIYNSAPAVDSPIYRDTTANVAAAVARATATASMSLPIVPANAADTGTAAAGAPAANDNLPLQHLPSISTGAAGLAPQAVVDPSAGDAAPGDFSAAAGVPGERNGGMLASASQPASGASSPVSTPAAAAAAAAADSEATAADIAEYNRLREKVDAGAATEPEVQKFIMFASYHAELFGGSQQQQSVSSIPPEWKREVEFLQQVRAKGQAKGWLIEPTEVRRCSQHRVRVTLHNHAVSASKT